MLVLDASVVNIAAPSIQVDLGFSDANLSWVVNAYVVAFGGLLLLGGRLGDLLGRRRVFMAGIALFAVASFLGGIAQGEATLLLARALQGLGAAVASPTALALITTTFPAGPPRNRAMAVYAAMSAMGAAIGLIVGGSLTEVSWRWTMFINVPIAVLVLLFISRFVGESPRQHGDFDFLGAVVGTGGLVSLVYGLTHAATYEWTSAVTITTLALGVVLLVVFIAVESRREHPLLPPRIIEDRTRAISFVSMLIVGATMFAMFYFISLFVQQVLGYSPLKAGVAFLPFTVGVVVSAQIASTLAPRVDPRWIAGTGLVISATGMWGYTRLDVNSSYATDLLPWISIQSIGMGLVFVPLTLTAVSRVAHQDSGVGSAVLNTMQQVGGALGLATLGTIAVQAAEDEAQKLAQTGAFDPEVIGLMAQAHGSTQAFWVAALTLLAGAIIVFVGLSIKHQELATDDANYAA
jgi:EmrB/QacA subfamily drug resistance transporter